MKSSIVLISSIVAAIVVVAGIFVFFKPQEEVTLPISFEYYYDLRCGACNAFHPVVNQLNEEFGPEVTFEYVQNPILGAASVQAAYAAEAAKEQGAYQEYIDIAFENFEARTDEDLVSFAEQLDLDIEKFNADREDPLIQARVDAQFEENQEEGITSTPTVFVNGRLTSLRTFDDLKALLEEKIELGKQQAEENGEEPNFEVESMTN